jgi:acyl-CoA dehydrogenase
MPDTILYDSAMRLFGDLVTPEVSAAAERGAWPDRLWRAVEEAGYPGVLAEGAAGMAEAATILCAAGEAPAGALTIGPVEPEDRLEITEAAVSGHAGYIPWGTAAITGLQPSAARCTVPEYSLASPHRCAAVLFRRARVCAEPCIR